MKPLLLPPATPVETRSGVLVTPLPRPSLEFPKFSLPAPALLGKLEFAVVVGVLDVDTSDDDGTAPLRVDSGLRIAGGRGTVALDDEWPALGAAVGCWLYAGLLDTYCWEPC